MKILVYSQRIGNRTINFIHNEIRTLDINNDVLLLSHFISDENPLEIKNLKSIRHYENTYIGKAKSSLNKIGIPLKSFEKDFKQHVDRFEPDVIHIHFGNIALRVLEYFQRTDIPIFISFHGYDASKMLKKPGYPEALSKLFVNNHIHPIFVSNFMLNNVKNAGVNVRHHNILYYGTDVSKFKRTSHDLPKDPFIFLQISSFAEKKGHRTTIAAYKKFLENHPESNTRLVLGGGGPGIEEIQEYCNALELSDKVDFKGWVNIDQAKDLMESSHAFIHHSIIAQNGDMEGIPNAIMEAMAMELPVLSTYHSGIPELVENEVNGYLVEENDVDALSESMKKVLSWPYKPINREKVLNQFEKVKHGELLQKMYKSVLLDV